MPLKTSTTVGRRCNITATCKENQRNSSNVVKPVAPRATAVYQSARKQAAKELSQTSLKELKTRMEQQEQRLQALEGEKQVASQMQTVSFEELKKQEQQKAWLQERYDAAKLVSRQYQNELQKMREKYDSLKQSEENLERLSHQAHVEIQCLKTSLESERCRASLFDNEFFQQKERMQGIKEEIEVLTNSLQSEQTFSYNLKNEYSGILTRIEELQREVNQLERNLSVQNQNMTENSQKQSQIEDNIAKCEEQLKHYSDKVMKLINEQQEISQTIESKQQSNEAMLSQLCTLQQDRDSLLERYEKLESETEELKICIRQKSDRLESTKQELAELQSSLKENCLKSEQLLLYKNQTLLQKKEEKEKLETELEEVKKLEVEVREEWNQKQTQVEDIQKALNKKEQDINDEKHAQEALVAETKELQKNIAQQKTRLAELDAQSRCDEVTRRRLHNLVQELKGNIRVFCRIRPTLAKEIEATLVDNVSNDTNRFSLSSASSVSSATSSNFHTEPHFRITSSNNSVEVFGPQKNSDVGKGNQQQRSKWTFTFDRIFDPYSRQEDVFDEISQLVQSALDGYRVCIFAYGQTGSGKTYTMLGGENEEESGMIPRSMRKIFATADRLREQNWDFSLKASFLEIYNETIRDLLAEHHLSKDKNYDIKIDRLTGATYVVGLNIEEVSTPEQLDKLLRRSMRNRATAATRCNDRSSRSHSVFRLYISGKNKDTGQETLGLLNLIDLAGSERLNASGSTGERLKETQHINKSLSALGDVISSLSTQEKHIPYRNSKLTYLLQDSLGGDSKTLMFVNISPTSESFQESLCSLRFAQKVNSCQIGTARRVAKVDLCNCQ
eukprot:jgi/Galph1/1486/GphlegSOOS_G172.1